VPAAERVQALRNVLADAVDTRQTDVSRRLYQASERSAKADVGVVRNTFPELPLTLSEKLLAQASPVELQRTVNEKHLPLRLKTQARELDFEARASRAYEGFYRDDQLTADTERLALGTLRIHTDTFANLRIEVRDGTLDGPLRCSVGPDDASTLRRLVRDEHGRYEVFDASHRSLHAADDFYESMLHAVPAETLSSVGYRRGQGHPLKLWLMELSAAPAERRSVLADPPIRPVISIETETLVRGLPRLLRASTREEKISDLYPSMTQREVASLLETLQRRGNPDEAIARLHQDLNELSSELDNWRESYPPEVDPETGYASVSSDYLHNGGRDVEDQLIKCFRRQSRFSDESGAHPEDGYTLDFSSEFLGKKLEPWWDELRKRPKMKRYFDRITAFRLDRTPLSSDPSALLSSFPNLRQLSAQFCQLQELPSVLGLMSQLRVLDLADNQITLSIASRQQLAKLTELQTLNLNGNPLILPPDIGRMDHLTELRLAYTDIESWPDGLFTVNAVDKPRPRGFMLDMRASPVENLPEVIPGSSQAHILSRTRFDPRRLSKEDRVRYGSYRESVGMALAQKYLPAADNEISHWMLFPEDSTPFGPSIAFRKYRDESWHDLMAEPHSGGFFAMIRKLRESADYRSDQGRRRLTQRVWEMVDAAALDTKLRNKLFKQVVEPDDCGDFGAQLFNSLGMKVLVSKAYDESTTPAMLEDRLVRLARSAARLNRVTDEAMFEYKTQARLNKDDPRNPAPDEVEVHMAFETGLAERLQLPWQTEGMLYRARSGVTDEKINKAYETIKAGEQGDGLVNGMLELYYGKFWEKYLQKTYPQEIASNDLVFRPQAERLEELRNAKAEWAAPNKHTNLHTLSRRIQTLADELGIADAPDLFDDAPMSDERYTELYDGISYQRKELLRRLTREAMARAGL
jgi:hypothetical protein